MYVVPVGTENTNDAESESLLFVWLQSCHQLLNEIFVMTMKVLERKKNLSRPTEAEAGSF